jgi:uncharacterized protein
MLGFLTRRRASRPAGHAPDPDRLRAAAAAGDTAAQFQLGHRLAGRAASSESRGEALKWWARAAEGGFSDAQLWLGLLYWRGHFVEADRSDALKWTLRAADQGHAVAQHTLARMLCEMFGDRDDCADLLADAFMWSSIAHRKLWGRNQRDSATMRAAIAAKLSPDQITEAQRRALDWRPMPAPPPAKIERASSGLRAGD